jgi:uridine kinase
MEIIEFLKSKSGFIGITGPAGSGKTYLCNLLSETLSCSIYSIDYRFIGDTKYRNELLQNKFNHSIDEYKDACNQYNWWDWNKIIEDINLLKANSPLEFNTYDRNSGEYFKKIIPNFKKINLIEGAILGSDLILNTLDYIIFIVEEDEIRFLRLLEKDKNRRNINEICARFLITQYSESLYYNNVLFKIENQKILFINSKGNFIPLLKNKIRFKNNFIPYPMEI